MIPVKAISNTFLPGSGAATEFAQAGYYFWIGNKNQGLVCIVSGIADLGTLGLAGTTKELMKQNAKKSVIQFAKETAKSGSKEASKKVDWQVEKELAKGVIPSVVDEVWNQGLGTKMKFLQTTGLSAISSGGHQIGTTIFQDWLYMGITETAEALKRKPVKTAFDFTYEAAKKGAKDEFMNRSYELLSHEVNFALLKGHIRSNQDEDGR